MRSLLFVPADSERKIAKAHTAGADVVIFDLEDSVAASRKDIARELAGDAVAASPVDTLTCVRINPLGSGYYDDDLAAIMPSAPDLIMLPKSETGRDVMALAARLAVYEAEADLPEGATRVIPIATETPASLFGLGTYAVGPRIAGLAWGAEDLAAALGATRKRFANGRFAPTFMTARTLCLAGAIAADAAPIDTVFTDIKNLEGLQDECRIAAADGFTAKLAIHPDQVPVINEYFTPSAQAVAWATRIVAAFAADPDAGVISLDGEMIDRPHLKSAERILARVPEAEQ